MAGPPEGVSLDEVKEVTRNFKDRSIEEGIDKFSKSVNMSIAKMQQELNCEKFELSATANFGVLSITVTTANIVTVPSEQKATDPDPLG